MIFGNPKTSPIKNANFTSPNPIPLPLVIRNNNKKKKHAPIAESRWEGIKYLVLNTMYKNDIIIVGNITLSGIIPYFKSAKKTTIKLLTIKR
jgi:hypothetical protein